MRCAIYVGMLLAVLASPAAGAIIGQWDFDDSDLVVDTGSGTFLTDATGASFANDAPGDESLRISGTENNGKSITIAVDLSGVADPVLTFDARRNTMGFRPNTVSYSADGGATFTPVGTFNAASFFSGWTFNFDDVDALDNNPLARFRITLAGATNPGGFIGLDNVVVTVLTVPEPSGVLLWLAGALIALSHRKLKGSADLQR